MGKIKIKLLSVNQAWQGRRFKTPAYKAFENELMYLLPNKKIPEGKLEMRVKVGLSSKLSDVDNIAKPAIDIMQKRYNFNDRNIYKLILEKEIVKKGSEYLQFEILSFF